VTNFRANVIRANVIGKHLRNLSGSSDLTVVNRNIELALDARSLLPDDADWNKWVKTHRQEYLANSEFFKAHWEYRQEQQAEADRKRALPPQPSEPVELPEPEPKPVRRDEPGYRGDFTQAFVDEARGGRFARIEPRINDVPRQPVGSPWHSDPLPSEPTINFEAMNRVAGNELPPPGRPVTEEHAPSREKELLSIIERLKSALEAKSDAAAPVTPSSAVADATSTGEGKVYRPDPPFAAFSSVQKE
jgi:hypothetical protein